MSLENLEPPCASPKPFSEPPFASALRPAALFQLCEYLPFTWSLRVCGKVCGRFGRSEAKLVSLLARVASLSPRALVGVDSANMVVHEGWVRRSAKNSSDEWQRPSPLDIVGDRDVETALNLTPAPPPPPPPIRSSGRGLYVVLLPACLFF